MEKRQYEILEENGATYYVRGELRKQLPSRQECVDKCRALLEGPEDARERYFMNLSNLPDLMVDEMLVDWANEYLRLIMEAYKEVTEPAEHPNLLEGID